MSKPDLRDLYEVAKKFAEAADWFDERPDSYDALASFEMYTDELLSTAMEIVRQFPGRI